jgi:hypothetical protein
MLDIEHQTGDNHVAMRTTLNISVEAMARVRQLAEQRGATLGAVVSELVLKALQPDEAPPVRNGVPLFPAHQHETADLDLVNQLRDEEHSHSVTSETP